MTAENIQAVLPEGFRYFKAYMAGKPRHGRNDPFRIRHPKMDMSKRAKIFAPFDALRGFSAKILAEEENSRRSETAG